MGCCSQVLIANLTSFTDAPLALGAGNAWLQVGKERTRNVALFATWLSFCMYTPLLCLLVVEGSYTVIISQQGVVGDVFLQEIQLCWCLVHLFAFPGAESGGSAGLSGLAGAELLGRKLVIVSPFLWKCVVTCLAWGHWGGRGPAESQGRRRAARSWRGWGESLLCR